MTKSVESQNARVSPTPPGETLGDRLSRQKRLAFSTVVDYLDQLSEAIDLAHEQGFIHRNLNPSTILLTDEDHLVILGLRSTGGRKHSRETRGTAYDDSRLMRVAYMAPEQILTGSILLPDARDVSNIPGTERTVDGRADLYSLGVILYQMVTGVLPFQAETLEEMALMHLRVPPPSPRQFRPDLPLAAEQAMLRALAKRPADRYVRAQDLATALSVALIAACVLQIEPADAEGSHDSSPPIDRGNVATSHFKELEVEPADNATASRSNVMPSPSFLTAEGSLISGQALSEPFPVIPSLPQDQSDDEDRDEDQPTNPVPVVNAAPSPSIADVTTPIPPTFPVEATPASPVGASAERSGARFNPSSPPPIYRPSAQETSSTTPTSPVGALSEAKRSAFESLAPQNEAVGVPLAGTLSRDAIPTHTGAQPASVPPGYNPTSPLPATSTTDALSLSNREQGNTGTIKLTGPAKIVQVPVAGQPGLYVTGLLPVFPQQPSSLAQGDPSSKDTAAGWWSTLQSFLPIAGASTRTRTFLTLAVVVMFLVSGSGVFWFIHAHTVGAPSGTCSGSASCLSSQSFASLTATPDGNADANIILLDPLSQNIHNWPVATTGSMLYIFENGAYHITDNSPTQSAPAILPDEILHGSFAYTLTMEEIKGDDTSSNNEFGMIVRASSQNQHGKIVTTFYSFEVLNTKNGEYQFWKYDSSSGSSSGPWIKLWHHSFGKEFHQGHGPGSINTFKIFVNGNSFTLIVNGKQIAKISDTSCDGCPCICSGGIGMLVNLKGTEVAFSNLRLTHM